VLHGGKRKIAVAQLRGKTTSDGVKTGHIITLACRCGCVKTVSSGWKSPRGGHREGLEEGTIVITVFMRASFQCRTTQQLVVSMVAFPGFARFVATLP